MVRKSGIYLITCNVSGDKYVGSAVNINRRIGEHVRDLSSKIHHNSRLQKSWDKHGESCFVFSVLEVVIDKSSLVSREQFWIDIMNPELNIYKTALSPGLGRIETPETKERRSITRKQYWESLTDEQKNEFRLKVKRGWKEWWDSLNDKEKKSHIGKISNPHTPETRKLLSDKTNKAYAEGRLSRVRGPHSEETKKKLSDAAKEQFSEIKKETAKKRAEWELGREERELERRRKVSASQKGKTVSEATKDKLRQAANSQWLDPEYKRKHHKALKKVMSSPEMAEKLSKAHKGKKLSKDHIAKITSANVGKKRSKASCKRLSEARKAWWARRKAK